MDGNMIHTKCKIAGIKLEDNFLLCLEKRAYFILDIKNTTKEIYFKFYRLRNHFVNCEIFHEKLIYVGHVSIRDISEYSETPDVFSFSVKVCFEA
jgi:hypothetical protein